MTEDENKTPNEESKSGENIVKDKDKRTRKDKANKPLSKIIIRRLPPSMTEETFMKQIEPIPDHDYMYYVSADLSLGQNAFCRAYINLINQDDIFIFKDKFDGYVFIDAKGAEFSAVVEFAPFQSLPRNRARKKDNKCNTIDNDQHYINFLESLNNEDNEAGKTETKLEFSYQFRDDKRITSTPLLEYLANKKHERREEKKKKIDDRKRQRDEERQRKKNFVSNKMPSAIMEEESKDDDIMVRTIRSRLGRNRNKKDRLFESKPNNPNSEERYKKSERAERRSERRRAEREKRLELQLIRKDEPSVESKEEIVRETVEIPFKEVPVAKREVKKYSEVRKERRARAEAGSSKFDDKCYEKSDVTANQTNSQETAVFSSNETSQTEIVKHEHTHEKLKSPDEKPKRERSERSQRKLRERDERAARRIRNKDRPSIEIYRPGKLRTQKKSDTASGEEGGKDSPELIDTPKYERCEFFDKLFKLNKNDVHVDEVEEDDKSIENDVFEIETKTILEDVNKVESKSPDLLFEDILYDKMEDMNLEEIDPLSDD